MNDTRINIGTRLGTLVTFTLAGLPDTYVPTIEKRLYPALLQLAENTQLGDWIELPDGTTFVCTFKPERA
jgi:hypothetical protein